MVVLAVVGVGATLLLPRLGDLGRLELERAAQHLADDLTLARQQAILGGTPGRVRLDLDRGQWTVAGARRDVVRLPHGVRVHMVAAGDEVIGGGAATVVLDPAGDPLPARIELADSQGRRASVLLPPVFAPARVIR
jgi:hypothetical protein